MRRFFIDEIKEKGGFCVIEGSEAKHITKVLRMKPEDRFVLMDSKGSLFLALIESIRSGKVIALLEKPLPKPPASPVRIILCQALLKSSAMDVMIQKISELGVDCICPFSSERTVVALKKDRLANKMRHWNEIAINSAKQCGRPIPIKIEKPSYYKEMVTKWMKRNALKVILWEAKGAKDFKALLKSSASATEFVGIVGPEGGFDRREIGLARDAGFIAVTIGDRILRADTAAITAAAIVQYELGDLCMSALD